ncbi:MAG: hypothetical protein R2876_06415 [Eubacteriales bacterium]
MKNLIITLLAVIGVAAIMYFGWDWISAGIQSLFDSVKGFFSSL